MNSVTKQPRVGQANGAARIEATTGVQAEVAARGVTNLHEMYEQLKGAMGATVAGLGRDRRRDLPEPLVATDGRARLVLTRESGVISLRITVASPAGIAKMKDDLRFRQHDYADRHVGDHGVPQLMRDIDQAEKVLELHTALAAEGSFKTPEWIRKEGAKLARAIGGPTATLDSLMTTGAEVWVDVRAPGVAERLDKISAVLRGD